MGVDATLNSVFQGHFPGQIDHKLTKISHLCETKACLVSAGFVFIFTSSTVHTTLTVIIQTSY